MSTVFVKKMQHWLISTLNASLHSRKKGKIMSFSFYYVRKMTAITDKHCLQKVLIPAVWDDVYQCLITILRQFFKSALQNALMGKKKRSICCALITDYYNPMNKHLSCQHLRYELLPHDCDAIWISPHATFYVKKSLSNHSSNVRKAAHRASCWPQDLRYAQFHRTIWGLKRRLRNISACHPLCHPSSSTSHKRPKNLT